MLKSSKKQSLLASALLCCRFFCGQFCNKDKQTTHWLMIAFEISQVVLIDLIRQKCYLTITAWFVFYI